MSAETTAGGAERRPLSSRAAAWFDDPRLPVALLAGALVLSGVLLVALSARLTFFIDDWEVLLDRRGFDLDDFLKAHAGHPTIGIAILYKAIQATFGMSSVTPYAIASTLFFCASVVLLFAWMRPRVGGWLALAGSVAILFLGAAYEDLLTPFQVGYFAPVAFGLGALLVLERGGRHSAAVCCALLVAGLCFQTIGLAFVAGVGVALFIDGRLRRLAWVPLIPIVLYALWWLGYGHTDSNQFTFENLATAPAFVIDGFAASVASLLGFATPADGGLGWGRALLAALVVLCAARLLTLRRVPNGLWVVLTIGVIVWVMIALNASYFRSADTSRYQYLGAIFVLMAVTEVWRGVRPGRVVVGLALVAVAAAVAGNINTLRDAYLDLKAAVPVVRGDLAALEIAADTVDPNLVLTPDNSNFDYFTLVEAGSYLSAADAFGSPAYDQDELAAAPETGKAAADKVLGTALGLALRPADASASATSTCEPVDEFAQLPDGGVTLRATRGDAGIALRRYATESSPVELGRVRGGHAAALEIPRDRSEQPWVLTTDGAGLELCTAGVAY